VSAEITTAPFASLTSGTLADKKYELQTLNSRFYRSLPLEVVHAHDGFVPRSGVRLRRQSTHVVSFTVGSEQQLLQEPVAHSARCALRQQAPQPVVR
jgi:hypothetical protein